MTIASAVPDLILLTSHQHRFDKLDGGKPVAGPEFVETYCALMKTLEVWSKSALPSW